MGRSQTTFSKREKEKKRQKKREEKAARKEERKANSQGGGLENMMAYVDENGVITDTPPDPSNFEEVDAESIVIGVPKKEESDEPTVREGIIDFFDETKGFGFIKEIGTQERFFVHVTGLEDEVIPGNKVSFELEQGLKGLNAVRVKKV
ncbi:MAG: cold shock domain-containing protein [Flavobacteriales bacterium]|nr:cold shock domain-containing protein [Flavobacteriales bacterium]